jgi:signal transduction histidine kinase
MLNKTTIFSNMSHEIRTPMNAIIGFTKWYLKQIWLRNKRISKCYKNERWCAYCTDILDLVDAGKMSFDKTPLVKSSISSMLHLFETKIREKFKIN